MAQDSQSIESIFDFFYVDTTRIKSYYAQITGNGSITSRKSISAKQDVTATELSGSIPTIATAKQTISGQVNESAEDLFDAAPTMPRDMINKLDDMGYVSRSLSNDQLGGLVLLKGVLGVADMTVLKAVVDPLTKFIFANQTEKTNAEKQAKKKVIDSFKPAIELLKEIPYSLEARLLVNTGEMGENGIPFAHEVWMTLSRGEMVGSPHDLNFKHGEFMPGEWCVLGILDALPYDGFKFNTENNEIKQMMSTITETLKEQFGRPSSAYGITPVAIFRVIRPKG